MFREEAGYFLRILGKAVKLILRKQKKTLSLHPKVGKSVEEIHKIELSNVNYEDRKRHYQSV